MADTNKELDALKKKLVLKKIAKVVKPRPVLATFKDSFKIEKLDRKVNNIELYSAATATTDKCTYASIAIAAQCWKDGVSVYTEGAWSDTNDAAPTNGEESPDPMRQ